ncbi:uncharacterized protein LOC127842206 [Dreissena polymorpha]|uniref:Uncharacterized protein n=1 Tax=Dreissena polymorpha TaxID=45954 RepID=A0A9D4EI90_DREPO|nr:uncharacterized protein LOC127842206 [Dreissena polymorpha]KAH3780145.1 hypothetical protein DPMN_157955 [Dreissena polymorpha]
MATTYIWITGMAAAVLIPAVCVHTDEEENSDLDNLIAHLENVLQERTYEAAETMKDEAGPVELNDLKPGSKRGRSWRRQVGRRTCGCGGSCGPKVNSELSTS